MSRWQRRRFLRRRPPWLNSSISRSLASGDIDVINTTLQWILSCKDDVEIRASIGGERIAITPDTPADVREKIAAVAQKTMVFERAAALAAETDALIYWQNADTTKSQIEKDIETIAAIDGMLN